MKADLTKPENSSGFILQYHGQKVVSNMDLPLHIDDLPGMVVYGHNLPLSLRHINTLTLEQKKVIVEMLGYLADKLPDRTIENIVSHYIHSLFHGDDFNGLTAWGIKEVCDQLIEWGYLIPYRGNSCEELIAAGLAIYRKEDGK